MIWDERYSDPEYVYGKKPNQWLKQNNSRLPKGEVLCLAAGEGRNAVYLAQQGQAVTAVDASKVGLQKAQVLAEECNVTIHTRVQDLQEYALGRSKWDVITSFFCHTPPPLRKKIHAKVLQALKPGGMFILEAYSPRQLQFGTGGPPLLELLMDLEEVQEELSGLHVLESHELIRNIQEGPLHNGQSAVIQMLLQRTS